MGNWCTGVCLHTKDSILAVVRVCLLGRLKLVELEDIVDQLLFAGRGDAGRMGALG